MIAGTLIKMQTYTSDGIILHAFNFRDFDQIVTAFTENQGLIKFIVKKGNLLKKGLKSSPFTKGQFVYTVGKSELYSLQEISVKDHYLDLRKNYTHLTLGCRFLKSILETQMLHKPAPLLYQLLIVYLGKIGSFSNLKSLEASFHVKILLHEGVLDVSEGSFFSANEHKVVLELAETSSFAHLETLVISNDLELKIKHLFKEFVNF